MHHSATVIAVGRTVASLWSAAVPSVSLASVGLPSVGLASVGLAEPQPGPDAC